MNYKVGDVISVSVKDWFGYSIILLTEKIDDRFKFKVIKHNADWNWKSTTYEEGMKFLYDEETYYKLTKMDLDILMVEDL